MLEEILFPTDGSDGATAVAEHVFDLAAATDATVHVLNVADTTQDSLTTVGGEVIDVLEQEGEEIVEAHADRARERGVSVRTEVVQGRPHEEILRYAASGVDLVVMPTHGRRGLERFLLGSVTERVVRRADVPVLTVRPDADVEYPYRNVLVPTDGSACANEAVETGIDFANAHDAGLHLLSVVNVTSLGIDMYSEVQMDVLEERAEEAVRVAANAAENAGVASVSTSVTPGGSVHGQVLSYVEENDVDLVVVGTHGWTGLDRYLLGSVAEKLLRTSPVPVVTVREPSTASE